MNLSLSHSFSLASDVSYLPVSILPVSDNYLHDRDIISRAVFHKTYKNFPIKKIDIDKVKNDRFLSNLDRIFNLKEKLKEIRTAHMGYMNEIIVNNYIIDKNKYIKRNIEVNTNERKSMETCDNGDLKVINENKVKTIIDHKTKALYHDTFSGRNNNEIPLINLDMIEGKKKVTYLPLDKIYFPLRDDVILKWHKEAEASQSKYAFSMSLSLISPHHIYKDYENNYRISNLSESAWYFLVGTSDNSDGVNASYFKNINSVEDSILYYHSDNSYYESTLQNADINKINNCTMCIIRFKSSVNIKDNSYSYKFIHHHGKTLIFKSIDPYYVKHIILMGFLTSQDIDKKENAIVSLKDIPDDISKNYLQKFYERDNGFVNPMSMSNIDDLFKFL